MRSTNCNLLIELLKLNSIKVDEKELEFQFKSHPSYPSLHALTGVLNHFKVPNMAVEVPKSEETLKELPPSFLALMNKGGERLALVVLDDGLISLYDDKKQSQPISTKEFLGLWSGVVVVVEKDEGIKSSGSPKNWDLKLVFSTLLILSVGFFIWSNPSIFQLFHFSLSILGIIICILLVQHDLGIRSKPLEKICSGKSEKVNCDDILQSKAAMIFGKIKWSDIGLTYFVGITLSWLLIKLVPNSSDSPLVMLTVCGLPFTFYSIYLQLFKLKKWCPLCLSVLAVLWAQAAVLFLLPSFKLLLPLHVKSIILTGYSLFFTYALWKFIKAKLEMESDHKKLSIGFNRFKRSFKVFKALLCEKPSINTAIDNCHEVVLGCKSKDAPLKIVLVTNPLCSHCKSAHRAIIPLLASASNQIQIIIRFNVNVSDENSNDTKAALTILKIYRNKSEPEVLLALDELYSTSNLNAWQKKWGRDINHHLLDDLKKQKDWCSANEINFTPEILVNGRPFPNEYERDELNYFIDDLIEEHQHNS